MKKLCKMSGEVSGEFLKDLRFLAANVFFHRIDCIERKSYNFIEFHRKPYIFQQFLTVTPRPGRLLYINFC